MASVEVEVAGVQAGPDGSAQLACAYTSAGGEQSCSFPLVASVSCGQGTGSEVAGVQACRPGDHPGGRRRGPSRRADSSCARSIPSAVRYPPLRLIPTTHHSPSIADHLSEQCRPVAQGAIGSLGRDVTRDARDRRPRQAPPSHVYQPNGTAPAAVAAGPAVAGPDGSLGTVQYGGALLTVYGCSRQGSQVACDADFNNQNQRQTQLNNGWWRDMYVVDQNGDRHERSTAYFVNPEGQPRETIDVPYGQSARYILVFNDVSPNVSMVSLHSVYGQLNIQNIPLDAAAAAASPGQAPGQPGAVGNAVSGTTDTLRTTGKQTASDAQQKAMGKGQDALQKLLNKVK